MVIAIIGEKRVGKDMAFNIIKEALPEWERIGLADEIKSIVSDVLHIPLNIFENMKNNETMLMPRVTARTILQDLGQRLKLNFGKEIWCEQALNKMIPSINYVITDIRFPFELGYFKKLDDVIAIRILRDTNVGKDNHPSETSSKDIEADYEVVNNGTMAEFKTKILDILKEEKLI